MNTKIALRMCERHSFRALNVSSSTKPSNLQPLEFNLYQVFKTNVAVESQVHSHSALTQKVSSEWLTTWNLVGSPWRSRTRSSRFVLRWNLFLLLHTAAQLNHLIPRPGWLLSQKMCSSGKGSYRMVAARAGMDTGLSIAPVPLSQLV
jgi:hypothetical protein